jgi:hypothetical protein
LPIGIVFEGKGLDIFVKKFALLVSLLVSYAYGFLPFVSRRFRIRKGQSGFFSIDPLLHAWEFGHTDTETIMRKTGKNSARQYAPVFRTPFS